MARIRTIKPSFFTHFDLFEAERESGLPLRVAFAGLWTAADREGRFRWRPTELKLACLPFDEVDFSRVLDALATRGFLVRYASIDGREYGAIPSWGKHQVINNRESASEIPAPPSADDSTPSTRAPRVDDACPTPLRLAQGEGKGREGEGKETHACEPVAPFKPKPYAHALIPKRDMSAFWEGALFNVPGHWAAKALKASNGKAAGSDVVKFAQQLTAKLERDGGEVPVAGFLGWLDTEWAAYRQPAVSDGYRPAAEWIAQNLKDSEGSCTPEEARAILTSTPFGKRMAAREAARQAAEAKHGH